MPTVLVLKAQGRHVMLRTPRPATEPRDGPTRNFHEKYRKNTPRAEILQKLSHHMMPKVLVLNWRQIWRVAGRESGSPELLGSPRTSPEVFGDFLGISLTVELNSNPEVTRKFPKLPRKFRDFPGGQPLSLGSLTPSPDSQKLSLIKGSRTSCDVIIFRICLAKCLPEKITSRDGCFLLGLSCGEDHDHQLSDEYLVKLQSDAPAAGGSWMVKTDPWRAHIFAGEQINLRPSVVSPYRHIRILAPANLQKCVGGVLLYKIWRILPGIFLEDFSGHFFPQKSGEQIRRQNPRKNPAAQNKNPRKIRSAKNRP